MPSTSSYSGIMKSDGLSRCAVVQFPYINVEKLSKKEPFGNPSFQPCTISRFNHGSDGLKRNRSPTSSSEAAHFQTKGSRSFVFGRPSQDGLLGLVLPFSDPSKDLFRALCSSVLGSRQSPARDSWNSILGPR